MSGGNALVIMGLRGEGGAGPRICSCCAYLHGDTCIWRGSPRRPTYTRDVISKLSLFQGQSLEIHRRPHPRKTPFVIPTRPPHPQPDGTWHGLCQHQTPQRPPSPIPTNQSLKSPTPADTSPPTSHNHSRPHSRSTPRTHCTGTHDSRPSSPRRRTSPHPRRSFRSRCPP